MHMKNKGIPEECKALIELRMDAYGILNRTFLEEPARDFLQLLRKNQFLESFPFQDEHPLIKQGIELALRSLGKLDPETYERIRWDYTRLFIGPYKIPAPPWESVYVNKERLIFQEETLNVRRAYLKYCLMPRNTGREADDHLGYELDFMYQLCRLSLESSEFIGTVLSDQKSFLENHILKWVPIICKDIFVHAKTDFYKGMAICLEGFLEIDKKALNELMDQLVGCDFSEVR